MISEAISIYGEQKNLQGIASIPDEYRCRDVAVILLNAGMVRKVGPFNMNVDIARKLAYDGYFAFRFDMAGLGDSTKIKTGKTHLQDAIDNMTATMSHIEAQYKIHKFIFMGLCTGADHSHIISVQDERVVGNIWLDGYGFPTPKFWVNRIMPVLLDPVRLIKGIIRRLKPSPPAKISASSVDTYVWKLPERDDYIRDMEQTFQRDVKSLYLFSGGVNVYYNYKDQFKDGFERHDFWKNIEVEHYPEFSHTYLLIDDRQVMIKRVGDWLDKHFKD